ncbi:hypothetical protein [Joostella sp.]|uniref:hypothetical protein n=1 Tax=Joostella sp. TaxID=2231138 RepID=UPI003A8D87FE
MKKIALNIKIIMAVLVSSLTLSSCLLDDDVTDFGATPVLAQFESQSITANFIQTPENPVYSYDIPVVIIGGENQPIGEDVEVVISADPSSTAVEGVDYNFNGETTVTIPAGEMSTNITIDIISEPADPFDPKTLVLKIDSASKTISEDDKIDVKLQAVCELDLSSFVGSYTATEGSSTYTSEVTMGPEANSLNVTGLYGKDGNTIIKLSSDPTDPTITYLSQEYDSALYVHSSYGNVWATTSSPELSSYNSCDNSMVLEFKRCVSIGCFGGTVKVSLVKN